MTNGASTGNDLNFRDRVIEFIGTTTSTIKNIQKEISEIKITDKECAAQENERLTALEKKLNDLKVEYTVTKTKVVIWGSLAGGTLISLLKLGGYLLKLIEAAPK